MASGVDENSATEVGLAVKRFDRLRQLTNAGVLVVHHTAKHNPTAARGEVPRTRGAAGASIFTLITGLSIHGNHEWSQYYS